MRDARKPWFYIGYSGVRRGATEGYEPDKLRTFNLAAPGSSPGRLTIISMTYEALRSVSIALNRTLTGRQAQKPPLR